MACNGTYLAMYSIMRVGDAIAIPNFATVLVMEIEITMLYGKLTLALALVDNNISLEFSRMN